MDEIVRRVSGSKRKPRTSGPEDESSSSASTEAPETASAAAAGSFVADGMEKRIGKFLDVFETNVAFERPLADTSASNWSGASDDSGKTVEASQPGAPAAQVYERIGLIPNFVAISGEAEAAETDSIHDTAAREYLELTGRWSDVSGMTHAELNAAIKDEELRAILGIEDDAPKMSTSEMEEWGTAREEDLNAGQFAEARSELVASGVFTQDEVDGMSNADVVTALAALQSGDWPGEVEVERITADGQTTVTINGTSLQLQNIGQSGDSNTGGDGTSDTTDSSSGSSGSDTRSDDDQNEDDADDDDDDDDDDDEEAEDDPEVEQASAEEDEEGEGETTPETTPTPDAAERMDPRLVAAFLATPVGRESALMTERAIEMGVGGGLMEPEAPSTEAAWLESSLSFGDRSTNLKGIEVAKSGGHTDPTEDEAPRGISPINELVVTGGGFTDPVEDEAPAAPLDSPVFPVGPLGPSLVSDALSEARLGMLQVSLDLDSDAVAESLQDFED